MLRTAVTGSPGIGKSIVVAKVAEKLNSQPGFKTGGIQTAEIRKKGHREGFSIRNLATEETGTLSHIKGSGPGVGKYFINLEELEMIGVNAIRNAISCDLVVIDEIGPMELISESFVSAVEEILESDKSILAALHHSSRHYLA